MSDYRLPIALLSATKNEKQWKEAYARNEAQRELRRARNRATLRRIRALFVRGNAPVNSGGSAELGPQAAFLLPVNLVEGVVDEKTGKLLRLSGKLAARLWHRYFTQDGDDDGAAFTAARTARGWHLMGGLAALVRLEVLRSKGVRDVTVALSGSKPEVREEAAAGARCAPSACADAACPESAA